MTLDMILFQNSNQARLQILMMPFSNVDISSDLHFDLFFSSSKLKPGSLPTLNIETICDLLFDTGVDEL